MSKDILRLFQKAFSAIDHDVYLNQLIEKIKADQIFDFEFYYFPNRWKNNYAIVYNNYVLYFETLTDKNWEYFHSKMAVLFSTDEFFNRERENLKNKETASLEELARILLFSNENSWQYKPNELWQESPIDLYIAKSIQLYCAKLNDSFYIVIEQDGLIGYHKIYWEYQSTIVRALRKAVHFNNYSFLYEGD